THATTAGAHPPPAPQRARRSRTARQPLAQPVPRPAVRRPQTSRATLVRLRPPLPTAPRSAITHRVQTRRAGQERLGPGDDVGVVGRDGPPSTIVLPVHHKGEDPPALP